MNETTKIFLSHAREDSAKVEHLYQYLKLKGFDPWMDKTDLLPGQDWELEIEGAIERSHFFIACLSGNSVGKSGFVQKELKIALDLLDRQPEGTIFLIPALIESCAIPRRFQRLHCCRLSEDGGHEALISALEEGARSRGLFFPTPAMTEDSIRKGLMLMQLNMNDGALEAFKKATAADPSNADAWVFLGMVYRDIGRHPEAADCFKKAFQLKPTSGTAVLLGTVLYYLKKYDEVWRLIGPLQTGHVWNAELSKLIMAMLKNPDFEAAGYRRLLNGIPPDELDRQRKEAVERLLTKLAQKANKPPNGTAETAAR
jgi:tetratricopeptide (TPR) repeat protein